MKRLTEGTLLPFGKFTGNLSTAMTSCIVEVYWYITAQHGHRKPATTNYTSFQKYFMPNIFGKKPEMFVNLWFSL